MMYCTVHNLTESKAANANMMRRPGQYCTLENYSGHINRITICLLLTTAATFAEF